MEYMYPMDFEEFLMATSSQGLIDEIYRCYNEVIPMTNALHDKLLNLYRLYLCVGGMPQAVQKIADVNQNKKYISDVGLLTSLLEIQYNDILLDNNFLYKGNIAKNYVAEQLVRNGVSLYYWKSNSDAKIDFI